MGRSLRRALDLITDEPLRIRSFLRLVLILLIALLVHQSGIEHGNENLFNGILVAYFVAAVGVLINTFARPVRWIFVWAATFADVVIVLALCIASGPATISLYPIFFLLPITVAFLDNPLVTGALGVSASFGYLLAWIFYSEGDQIPGLVYVQVGCLLWLTAAMTALAMTLARRATRVSRLLDVRERLVAESMRADERQNRQLSERLHDGPLQNLLAARLDLDDLREHPSPEGFDRLDAALRTTVTALRTTVTTLHPQVLEQVGLTAAVRELAQQSQQRWGTTIRAELEEVGTPAAQALIYRAAREVLVNVFKHAQATEVDLELRRGPGSTVLRVADNGIGFDPEILDRRVAEGHIGLASLMVGVEATGGAVDFANRPGGGTVVTVTVPDHLDGFS